MKKVVLFLSFTLMILSGASSYLPPPAPFLLEGASCSEMYEKFSTSLDSGQIIRTEIGFETLLDFAGYTREEITFAKLADGKQQLTCREEQPLVFWVRNEADYFDGTHYYYAYNGDWFIDRRNHYTDHLRQDYFGIPTEVLESFPIVEDTLYLQQEPARYRGHMTFASENGRERWELTADLSLGGVFQEVWILYYAHDPNEPDEPARIKRYFHIAYDAVNQPQTIDPPQSLDPTKLVGTVRT